MEAFKTVGERDAKNHYKHETQTARDCLVLHLMSRILELCMATVMRVQERAENSALRASSVEGQWGGDVAA